MSKFKVVFCDLGRSKAILGDLRQSWAILGDIMKGLFGIIKKVDAFSQFRPPIKSRMLISLYVIYVDHRQS